MKSLATFLSLVVLGCGSPAGSPSNAESDAGRSDGDLSDARVKLDSGHRPEASVEAAPPSDAPPPKDVAPPPSYNDWTDPGLWESVAWPIPIDVDTTVFDGRYLYVGQDDDGNGGAAIFRYDSTLPFATKSSWSFVELFPGNIASTGVSAVAGGVVYFEADFASGIPVEDQSFLEAYVPSATYKATSWVASGLETCSVCVNAGTTTAGSDGTAAYFAFGSDEGHGLLRVKGSAASTLDFTVDGGADLFPAASGTAFDGTHLYFIAGQTGFRLPVASPFALGSLEAFDPAALLGISASELGLVRAAFDGRYVYFVPGSLEEPTLVRYDPKGSLSDPGSWSKMDASSVLPANFTLNAVTFDGRYLYLVGQAYQSGMYSLVLARFDSTRVWTDPSAWSLTPGLPMPPVAFESAAFDGQYLYFANGDGVWRLDARSPAPLPAFLPGGALE
jgi:hypothetical protein